MAANRKTYRIALVAAPLLIAAALVWSLVAVPALVKYPDDLDVTPRYEGTFKVFVDPATAAPLATPQEVPLTVERHLQAVEDETGASRVVVKETIRQRAGSLVDATQENQYVMDRRSMRNVPDGRAWAFTEQNRVDRAGSYRLQLPMGTDAGKTYEIYKNETASTYRLTPDADDPTGEIEGLDVQNYLASGEEMPLAPHYLAGLRRLVPPPEEMTVDQLKAQMAAAGVDLDKILPGVLAVLSPEDRATVQEALSASIPLRYVSSFDGRVAVEPDTGTEVNIYRISETIAAKPMLDNLAPLQQLLVKYQAEPAVQAAGPALEALASTPLRPLFQFEYAQTDESVSDIAAEAKSMRDQISLAERWIALGLAALGVVVLALGLVLGKRARRRAPSDSSASEAPLVDPDKAVSSLRDEEAGVKQR
jgi:hypothetical protein